MDGYALWVWSSYAVTALGVAGLIVVSLRTLRQRRRALAALEAASGRRRARGTHDAAPAPAASGESQP